jgi:hypothetical protein
VTEEATAALKEEEGEEPGLPIGADGPGIKKQNRTPPDVIAKFRESMVESFSRGRESLIKKSRALYWSADKRLRAVFAISRQYDEGKGKHSYWYAYHSGWDQFLGEAKEGFYVLGCIGRNEIYVLPFEWIHSRMKELNVTEADGKFFCHVFLYSAESGGLVLWLTSGKTEPLDKFKISIRA